MRRNMAHRPNARRERLEILAFVLLFAALLILPPLLWPTGGSK